MQNWSKSSKRFLFLNNNNLQFWSNSNKHVCCKPGTLLKKRERISLVYFCVSVSVCAHSLFARLSLGSRATAWCLSVYSTSFLGGSPQQLLTGFNLVEALSSTLLSKDLIADKMCIRYLGFVLLMWFSWVLHRKNIEHLHIQLFELVKYK